MALIPGWASIRSSCLQIILGLQTIPAASSIPTVAPSIVTIGKIQGGVRNKSHPDEGDDGGTLRRSTGACATRFTSA